MTVEENILAILETTVLTEEERVNKMNSLIEEFRIEHIRKAKEQSFPVVSADVLKSPGLWLRILLLFC